MHKLYERLIDLGLIEELKKKKTFYTLQQSKDWDAARLIEGRHYWKHTASSKQDKLMLKTIVLNHTSALCLNEKRRKDEALYRGLFRLGFEIVVRTGDHNYVKVKTYKELEKTLSKIALTPPDAIQSELISLHHDMSKIIILDDDKWSKLVTELCDADLAMNEDQTFNLAMSKAFTPENIDVLAENILNQYSHIKYECCMQPSFDELFPYHVELETLTFTWETKEFTKEELINLIYKLKNNQLDDVVTSQNPYHVKIKSVNEDENLTVELAPFEKVKIMELENIKLKNHGLLTDVQQLSLKEINEIEIDLSQHPNLEKITLEKTSNVSLTNSGNLPSHLKEFRFVTDTAEVRLNASKEILALTVDLDGETQFDPDFDFNNLEPEQIEYIIQQPGFLGGQLDVSKLKVFNISLPIDTLDISTLTSLESLDLETQLELTNIYGLNQCANLQQLKLNCNCLDLNKIMDQIPHIKKLVLRQIENNDLPSLPPDLEELTIADAKNLELIDLSSATHLKKLSIQDCAELKDLILPPQLTMLTISECPQLETTIDISNFEELELREPTKISFEKNVKNPPLKKFFVHKTNTFPFHELHNLDYLCVRKGQTDDTDYTYPKAKIAKLVPTEIEKYSNSFPHASANNPINVEEESHITEAGSLNFIIDNQTTIEAQTLLDKERVTSLKGTKVYDADVDLGVYRKKIYHSLKFLSDGNIERVQSTNNTLLPFTQFYQDNDALPAREQIRLAKGEQHVLTGLTANDKLCSFSDTDNFDIFYNPNDRQYIIKLKSTAPAYYNGVVSFSMAHDPMSFISRQEDVSLSVSFSPQGRLPQALSQMLEKVIASIAQNGKYFNMRGNTASDYLDEIIRFCRDFCEKEAFYTTKPKNNFGKFSELAKMITMQHGSCYHRSIIAKLLCDYYNIPASIIGNDVHAYLQVYLTDGQPISIDLGGSPRELTTIPIPEVKLPPKPHITGKEAGPSPKAKNKFLGSIEWTLKCQSFEEFTAKLVTKKKNFLLRTESKEQAFQCYCAFAKTMPSDFVYIHETADIYQLLEPKEIETFQAVEGPLAQLITKGSGIVLIDWTNFTPNERAIYKCLIDNPPTLKGRPLPPNVRVVGMLENNVETNDVFLSRTRSIPAPKHLLTNRNQKLASIASPAKQINLYHSEDWARLLLQEIEFADGKAKVLKKDLIEAMEQGFPLEIMNPPLNDENFELLQMRLQAEGKILFNGKTVIAKEGFSIKVSNQPIAIKPPAPLSVLPPLTNIYNKRYYINRANYSNLFKAYQISENDHITSKEGILTTLKPGDHLILTSELEPGELALLNDNILKLDENIRNQIQIYQYLEKQKPLTKTLDAFCQPIKSTHIESKDVHFVAKQLQKKMNIASHNVYYATGENSWANFIENVNLKQGTTGLIAKRTVSDLWKKLEKGETVLLIGDLPIEDQELLETLFAPTPYLYVNGERKEATGKLFWASKPQLVSTPLTKATEAYDPSILDYENALRNQLTAGQSTEAGLFMQTREINQHEIQLEENNPKKRKMTHVNEDAIKKINEFFSFANKLTVRNILPNSTHFTYEKYQKLYQKILANPQHTNPVKGILTYHYEKNSEEYAYINSISKMLFSNDSVNVRKKALNHLKEKIHCAADFDKHIWRIINCFSGKYILENFGIRPEDLTQDSLPQPNETIKAKVRAAINLEYMDQEQYKHPPSKQEKQKIRMKQGLLSDNSLFFLLGEAGAGKTTAVRALEKEFSGALQLFEGLEKLAEWSLPTSDQQYKVLLIDEGNMLPAERLEFLRGLTQSPPVLNHLGETTPLSQYHKVFVTGNPLSYAGREFHEVLWDCAEVIWFSPFEESFIKHFVLSSIERQCENHAVEIAEMVAQFFVAMTNDPDKMTDITLRDVENISAKILLYKDNNKYPTWQECAKQAIYAELHGTLVNKEARERFRTRLGIKPLKYQSKIMESAVITEEKMPIWDLINDDLLLRNHFLSAGAQNVVKRGILLEGASGLGKSLMMSELLRANGFSLEAENTQMRYYQVTAGDEGARAILLKAFDEGSIVILDELNLDPELEDLLNKQLLDPNNHTATKKGFMVLATQNPSHYAGCKPLSQAIQSRLHKVVMDEYSEKELQFIAEKKGHKKPEKFVSQFFKARKKYPRIVNTRTFFETLHRKLKKAV